MRLIDLSHPVDPGMPVWPGTPQPSFADISTIRRDGFAERQLCFSSHTGTHIDAASHIIEGGASLDRTSLDRFFGKGALVDLRDVGCPVIDADLLQQSASLSDETEFLLLHTGWSRFWGSDAYNSGFPVLSAEAARWLAASGLKGIGIDAPSFDEAASHHYPVHRIVLEAGIILIENLTALHLLDHCGFFLSVFPLSITGAEACPVRAVAILPPAHLSQQTI
ncbi:MAG: cyclase family protein [Chlorobiaceae bacterium]|nr:cyclase family protein [Chlorobiaceae bacterium]